MKIVALSRQIGSFGDEIAVKTAEKMGFELITQEAIHQMAESCDPAFKKACSLYEREIPKSFLERFFFDDPAYTSLFEALNFELASRGNVVVVGRGAQIVLQEIPGVLKTRIVAPTDIRVQRIMEQRNLSNGDARDYVMRHGHQRRALIEGIYHTDLSNWALYDLIVNTANMGVEAGADIVCAALQNLAPLPDEKKKFLALQGFAKRVESAIRREIVETSLGNITVESPDTGKVIIKGLVPEDGSKRKAQKIASSSQGVTAVDNQLRVVNIFGSF